jgi:hypothetical protein
MLGGAGCNQPKTYELPTTQVQQTEGAAEPDAVTEEEVFLYQPAQEDLSAEAQIKAKAAGGAIYLSPDPIDRVAAYYDTALATLEGFTRTEEQGVVRYRYRNSSGLLVDLSLTQAGPEKQDGTHILVVMVD